MYAIFPLLCFVNLGGYPITATVTTVIILYDVCVNALCLYWKKWRSRLPLTACYCCSCVIYWRTPSPVSYQSAMPESSSLTGAPARHFANWVGRFFTKPLHMHRRVDRIRSGLAVFRHAWKPIKTSSSRGWAVRLAWNIFPCVCQIQNGLSAVHSYRLRWLSMKTPCFMLMQMSLLWTITLWDWQVVCGDNYCEYPINKIHEVSTTTWHQNVQNAC